MTATSDLHRSLVAVATSAAMLASCGGSGARQPGGGAALFRQDCSECHSLIGNESLHRQGGDLVGYDLSREILAQFTREMPARRPLSADQLAAVVSYVYAAERRGRLR